MIEQSIDQDLNSAYTEAFDRFGVRALWSLRPVEKPLLGTRWQSPGRSGPGAVWRGVDLRKRSKDFVVPLSKLQSLGCCELWLPGQALIVTSLAAMARGTSRTPISFGTQRTACQPPRKGMR